LPNASAKLYYALSSARAILILPDFIRSCSADFKTKNVGWPDRKAGRAYGGNGGLAFAMCEARKKRKNRQGALKLFSVLIFGYFPSRESN
jgi:hypothetical protein